MRRTRILAGLVMAITLMWGTVPALAVPPEISTFEENNHGNPDVFEDQCGEGIDLIGEFDLKVRETVYFDADGAPIRVIVHFKFDGVLTRSDTGNSINDPSRWTLDIDLVTGEVARSGMRANLVYPGTGPVFQAIGRIVFMEGVEDPIFTGGQFDAIDQGKHLFEEACTALG